MTEEASARLRAALAERGVPVTEDELEEMARAAPALARWVRAVERLAGEWPAFAAPQGE